MWRQDSIVCWSRPMTLAGVTSLKEQNSIFVLQLSLCLSLFLCLFHIIRPFLCTTPSLPPNSFYARLSLFPYFHPFIVPMQVGLRGMLCCLICTAHSRSFIIVPLAAEALFFGQTMGGVVTESTVVMSHLPPRAISLSCPPSHPLSAFQ